MTLIPSHLKLIHDLADSLATCPYDASMDSAVQGDVFRDHFLQFIHYSLNGITCRHSILLIASNGNLILKDQNKKVCHAFKEKCFLLYWFLGSSLLPGSHHFSLETEC